MKPVIVLLAKGSGWSQDHSMSPGFSSRSAISISTHGMYVFSYSGSWTLRSWFSKRRRND